MRKITKRKADTPATRPQTRSATGTTVAAAIPAKKVRKAKQHFNPPLPNDILNEILIHLKENHQYKALTRVARVSKNMYDLVIPHLYETVVINKKNKDKVEYGHGEGSKSGLGQDTEPTRKDLATTYTRKVILKVIPPSSLSATYRHLNEMTLAAGCFDALYWPSNRFGSNLYGDLTPIERQKLLNEAAYSTIKKSLKMFAPVDRSSTPLHVQVHFGPGLNCELMEIYLTPAQSYAPYTIEFYNMSIDDWTDGTALDMAYSLGGVVQASQFKNAHLGLEIATHIAEGLEWCLVNDDPLAPSGRIYLCGIPSLVLSPEETESANDVDEAAMTKLCNLIKTWPDLSQAPALTHRDFFNDRVRLVGPGYRPKLADLDDIIRARSYSMAGLVDESSDADLSDSDDLDDWDDSDDSDFDCCALEVMALKEEQRRHLL